MIEARRATLENVRRHLTLFCSQLRELNASGNPCTPRDENGNVYGKEAMEWWYALVAAVPQVEVRIREARSAKP